MQNIPRRCGPQGFASDWLKSLLSGGHSYREDSYERSTGGEVSLVLFSAKASRGLTLLFHGTGNDRAFCWEPVITALLGAGQSILTFDLDGHGATSSTELSADDFWNSADDLRRYLASQGLFSQPLTAVGYSLGASLLMDAVVKEVIPANRVVLMALPSKVKPYLGLRFGISELLSIFTAAFYRQWRAVGWRHTVPAVGPFRRRSFPLRLRNRPSSDYVQVVDEILSQFDAADHAAKLGQNCLVVFGDNDHLTPSSDRERWRRANPRLAILRVDRSNHFLLPLVDSTVKAITSWICHEH